MNPASVPTLLAYRPGALGDALLALPAIAALREQYPDLHSVLATNATVVPLLRMATVADTVVSADDLRFLPLFRGDGAPQPVTDGPLVVAVAWVGDPDGVAERNLRALGARRIVVVPSRPEEAAGVHAAQFLLETLSPLGLGATLNPPRLKLPASDGEGVARWLEERGLEEPFLAVHPGSGGPRKNWPRERFAELIRLARSELGLRTVLMLGPAEDASADEGLGGCEHVGRVLVLRSVALEKLAYVLARAAGYLGNDSGISHLAAALGLAGVALFGPTDPAVWGPLGGGIRTLRAEDLESVSAERVLYELRDILGNRIPNCSP